MSSIISFFPNIINKKAAAHKLLAVASLLFLSLASYAQKVEKVDLKNADNLIGVPGKQILVGNVVFQQQETTIYCDSAYFYRKENSIDAFGNVKIVDGDSVTVTSRRLEYDGNTKQAKLRQNVVFTKLATATLYTDFLDYDRPRSQAQYYNGGRLVDSINVLTSRKGYYDVNNNMASFKKDVHVTNPDYTMTSDSLQYNSRTKVIYFRTETKVADKDGGTFIYEGGEYNTITRRSDFAKGMAETESYALVGKDYKLDDLRKVYHVSGDVVMTHKQENLTIYGQRVDYHKANGVAKVYDKAWLAKVTDDNDTLFISADTLVSIDSQDPSKKRLLAYNNVKIFKKDLQGSADSVEYRSADSTIYMYRDPVLWAEGNQMTADSIQLLIQNNTINRIFLNRRAFVISRDTVMNFNQIKGRRMVAEFSNNQIRRVLVEGNGESIYFALNEESSTYIGMNKIVCSNIIIRFHDGKVHNLSFYVNPDANFVPPHELKPENKKLKDFSWRDDVRPTRGQVVKSGIPDTPRR